jgi:hypothetical protein
MVKANFQGGAAKEVYDAILTAQRALVEARGQLIDSQRPDELGAVLACLHRAASNVESAMKACARACADGESDASPK